MVYRSEDSQCPSPNGVYGYATCVMVIIMFLSQVLTSWVRKSKVQPPRQAADDVVARGGDVLLSDVERANDNSSGQLHAHARALLPSESAELTPPDSAALHLKRYRLGCMALDLAGAVLSIAGAGIGVNYLLQHWWMTEYHNSNDFDARLRWVDVPYAVPLKPDDPNSMLINISFTEGFVNGSYYVCDVNNGPWSAHESASTNSRSFFAVDYLTSFGVIACCVVFTAAACVVAATGYVERQLSPTKPFCAVVRCPASNGYARCFNRCCDNFASEQITFHVTRSMLSSFMLLVSIPWSAFGDCYDALEPYFDPVHTSDYLAAMYCQPLTYSKFPALNFMGLLLLLPLALWLALFVAQRFCCCFAPGDGCGAGEWRYLMARDLSVGVVLTCWYAVCLGLLAMTVTTYAFEWIPFGVGTTMIWSVYGMNVVQVCCRYHSGSYDHMMPW